MPILHKIYVMEETDPNLGDINIEIRVYPESERGLGFLDLYFNAITGKREFCGRTSVRNRTEITGRVSVEADAYQEDQPRLPDLRDIAIFSDKKPDEEKGLLTIEEKRSFIETAKRALEEVIKLEENI